VELRKTVGAAVMSTVLMGGLLAAGCNDNVEVIRDPQIRVAKGMTWAWRPPEPPPAATRSDRDRADRPVTSRDVITSQPRQGLESNRDWNTEENRMKLQSAIARGLASKGLVKVDNPAVADFLVDYHVAVKTERATVQRVYPGGYPGVMCGPYGCWSGWGWGPPEVMYQNVRWHEGTFVFDLALREPKKLAYRAISQRELSKPQISPYQADEAVKHLLKGLKT
jgi:Domain of unknown function (DUF4136)